MELLKFVVRNQSLSGGRTKIISGSIDYVEAYFDFRTGDWDGLDKWAHFSKGETTFDVNLVDDRITREMHLNLEPGIWEVKLHGDANENGEVSMRITTGTAHVVVEDYGELHEGGVLPEVAATAAEQIAAKAQNALEVANSAFEKAGQAVVSDEQIAEAVSKYLAENPVEGGSAENGMPAGGKAGQYLRKKSDSDYDVEWADFEIPSEYGLVTYDNTQTITIT